MTVVAFPSADACASGFEPPGEGPFADPSPFVRQRNGLSQLELAVFGATCAACISKIEGALTSLAGIEDARLNLSTGNLSVSWRNSSIKPQDIIDKVQSLGYRVAPFDSDAGERTVDDESRQLLRSLAVAGFAAANIMLLSVSVWSGHDEMGDATRTMMHWVSALIAIPAVIFSGRPFFRSAFSALRAGRANMDVPISLGVTLALGLSIFETAQRGEHAYFDAAVMLLFFLLIGRYFDHRLRARARSAAERLLALQAKTATRLRPEGGAVESVAARDIAVGDCLLLSPGDRAPVNGVIVEGCSNIDLSLVTGESAPIRMGAGDALHAGVLNVSSRVIMRATTTTEDSLLAELSRLIEAGAQSKSRYVRLADRAAKLYVPVVHSLAAAAFVVWYFVMGAGLHAAVTNAIAVLIITCPCALGLAAPAVQIVATGRLFRAGVLVKSGDALERLSEVRAVVFDKTGTLTMGRLCIANLAEIPAQALAGAAELARTSRHPIARAIVSAAGPGPLARNAFEMNGFGVEGEVDGAPARLGKAEWVGAQPNEAANTETWYRRADGPPVRFVFADELRADAQAVIAGLKERRLAVAMLSGDHEAPTAAIARKLAIDWRAPLSPREKIHYVEGLARTGIQAAMIGDGLNDAPSLAAAHVALSPGTAADASQAAADFVYQGERLQPIIEAIDTARKARARMRENFAFAALYNFCAVPLAALGLVTPLIAALAMSGSSVIVVLNALRLAGGKRRRQ